MLKKKLLVVYLFFAAFGIFAQDMAVATVRLEKTEPVSGKKLQQTIDALEKQQGRKLTKDEKKQVLDQMINQILIIQAAEADRNITVSQQDVKKAAMNLLSQQLQAMGAIPPGAVLTDENQYKQVIQQQGMTVQEFEDSVRKQLLAEKYITMSDAHAFQTIPEPTEEEIEKLYQQHISEFVVSDSVWFKQIFFDTHNLSPADAQKKKAKAEEVYNKLINSPATFDQLIQSESDDDMSKARGGLIGPLMKGDNVAQQLYGDDFISKVFSLEIGKLSDVIKSNVGYHIIKVTEKRSAQLLTKDDPEVNSYLKQLLYTQEYQRKFDEVTQNVIKDLRSKATLNYFGEYR